jgi:Homeodomain-like domain
MRKRYVVRLSEEERAGLRTLVGRGTGTARMLLHARILLKANQGEGGPGWTDAAIAEALEVGRATVERVRQTYATLGLEAALARKAPERVYERKLDGAGEARLVALACSPPPTGQARWTLRLLAAQLVRLEVVDTISVETVRQALKQTSSSPG